MRCSVIYFVLLPGLLAGCSSMPEQKQKNKVRLHISDWLPEEVPDSVHERFYNQFEPELLDYPHPGLFPIELIKPHESIDFNTPSGG